MSDTQTDVETFCDHCDNNEEFECEDCGSRYCQKCYYDSLDANCLRKCCISFNGEVEPAVELECEECGTCFEFPEYVDDSEIEEVIKKCAECGYHYCCINMYTLDDTYCDHCVSISNCKYDNEDLRDEYIKE